LLLMVLLGASAYSIWQIRLLREDVDQLQASENGVRLGHFPRRRTFARVLAAPF